MTHKVHYQRPHPWHGLDVGPNPPDIVTTYIEICPFDLVKYEVDKVSGYLRVDRPQLTSSQPPTLYGFIPRTYCGARVGTLMPGATVGDGDPLDICVVSERPITRADILLSARVIGGIPMLDAHEADDKIIGVLERDPLWGDVRELNELPPTLIDRLIHYFESYKRTPVDEHPVHIGAPYDRARAHRVIQAAIEDYQEEFGARPGAGPDSAT